MSASIFDSIVLGAGLADQDMAALFDDDAIVTAMVRVEGALAQTQARLGIIPEAAGPEIQAKLKSFSSDHAALGAGTALAGVPVAALVAQLRAHVGGEAAQYIHWGATSQDIIDTGLVLRLRQVLHLLDNRLESLIALLAELADQHRHQVMAGRSRFQHAVPISFGLKLAGWLVPLRRYADRLSELRQRLLMVQFGGAAGTLAALGDKGLLVAQALAEALDLVLPPMPWHTQRDGLAEFASWLSLLSGSLGKLGQDFLLLAQNELAEASYGDGAIGGSSTMPQKRNPVAGETLLALARFNASQLSQVHHGMIQEQERGGAGWQLEWLSLPQMCFASGAGLRQAQTLISGLAISPQNMAKNLGDDGTILAEAAVFALARQMPREQAEDLVKAACRAVADDGGNIFDHLRASTDVAVPWDDLSRPENYLGVNQDLIDAALSFARKT